MSIELFSEDLTHFIILERSQENTLSDGVEQTERPHFLRKLPRDHVPMPRAPAGSHRAGSGYLTPVSGAGALICSSLSSMASPCGPVCGAPHTLPPICRARKGPIRPVRAPPRTEFKSFKRNLGDSTQWSSHF